MHDVIVVGGGPTGFVTALGLAQAGVDVLVATPGRLLDLCKTRARRSTTGRCSTGSSGWGCARRPNRLGSSRTTTPG